MYEYFVADVFTDTPLEGNQLAVFTDASGIAAALMQATARELNLSETVFVLAPEQGGDARIRIFTTLRELPFAGHPVLGTALIVGERLGLNVVRLECGVGIVPVELERIGSGSGFGRMEQPIPAWEEYDRPDELLVALGVESSTLPIELYANGPRYVYVTLASEDAVAALRPDLSRLAELLGDIGVSCLAGSATRWKTRMFAPGGGPAEDPATGSAAGPLAVHLARHGLIGFGEEIEIRQGAEIQRPATLYARVDGSAARIERVEVGGSAIVVARGEYRLE